MFSFYYRKSAVDKAHNDKVMLNVQVEVLKYLRRHTPQVTVV